MNYRSAAAAATSIAILLTLTSFAATAAADEFTPPEERSHQVDGDFHKLWSQYHTDNLDPSSTEAVEFMSSSSGYLYLEPPRAPDRWNRREIQEFEGGGNDSSIYPGHRTGDLKDGDGGLIHDAYVEVFAVTPSTKVHYGGVPEDIDEGQDAAGSQQLEIPDTPEDTLLVPEEGGEIHLAMDYRVDGSVDEQDVQLWVYDGRYQVEQVIDPDHPAEAIWQGSGPEAGGSITASYNELEAGFSGELAVSAFVGVQAGGEIDEEPDDGVTVDTSVEVTPYGFQEDGPPPALGRAGVHPDGSSALFLAFLEERGWSSIEFDDGTTVHSNLRFYSARDTDWDTALRSNATETWGDTRGYHPLQVHAYPSRSGVTVSGEATVEEAIGPPRTPPELPGDVAFDLPDEVYMSPNLLDVRHGASTHSVSIQGAVRSSYGEPRMSPTTQEIRDTDLDIEVQQRRGDMVQLAVRLEDSEGNPIDTRTGDDYIEIAGHGEVQTGLDGTTLVNLSTPASAGVTANYVAGDWHEAPEGEPGYLDTRAVTVLNQDYSPAEEAGMLLQLLMFLTPFFILVYMFDRMLGLELWPPWRGWR